MKHAAVKSVFLLLFTLLLAGSALAGSGTVQNGVVNLSISIEAGVPYDAALIGKIKTKFTEGSQYLYNATLKQNRFGKLIIIVPDAWPTIEGAVALGDLKREKADVKVTEGKVANARVSAFGSDTGCINLGTTNLNSNTCKSTITHEFGHYAYGLSDEYCLYVPRWEGGEWVWYQVFKDGNGNWNKCSKDVTWEVDPVEAAMGSGYSYPVSPSSPETNHVSIMWFHHVSPVTDFCSASNHNAACNHAQNSKNSFKSCWDVMASQTAFSLKKPGDTPIATITYQAPDFEIRQKPADATGQRTVKERDLELLAETDEEAYSYPRVPYIVAEIDNQGVPIRSAVVKAIITRPDGSETSVTLSDNGLQGDSTPVDGAYEGFFIDYNGDGEYKIRITADNSNHTAVEGFGFSDPDEYGSMKEVRQAKGKAVPYDFSLVATLPSIRLTGYSGQEKIPPGKITILHSLILTDGQAQLQWIAPGDDQYEGQAHAYEIRYSAGPISTDAEWNNATAVSNPPTPQPSGSQESFSFPLQQQGTIYLVVRALDENGTLSALSDNVLIDTSKAAPSAETNMPYLGASGSSGGGGCFIATAAYGSYLDPHVNSLCVFRDRHLMRNALGRSFVRCYYQLSPPFAAVISRNETLRAAARWLLTPVVFAVESPLAALLVFSLGSVIIVRVRRRKIKGRR
ncbi:MAG: CFI-box-CTERM domain-containing protein [Candidatus Eremiobacteraeota bacterium]|nr:CFI-box-CTERM domain-containing protein [Candidatus Eremiobacteraeota bacterium]